MLGNVCVSQSSFSSFRSPWVSLSFSGALAAPELLAVDWRKWSAAYTAHGDTTDKGIMYCNQWFEDSESLVSISITSFSLFRSVSSMRRSQWWCPLLQDQMQKDQASENSLFPAKCLSSRNWRCETVLLPLKSTSSCTCTPVRACRAELTPTWWVRERDT